MHIPNSVDDETRQYELRYNRLWRRETKAILAVFAVAMVPLGFLVRSRQFASQTTPVAVSSVDPNSPWRVSDNSYRTANIALSPSGNFLAAVCPPAAPKGATPLPNSLSMQGSDLVIWRILDGAEVARARLDGGDSGTIEWARNEAWVALRGQSSQIFAWRPGSLLPAPLPGIDAYVEGTWVDLDADLKVEAHSQNGWQAFQISTGKAIALAPQIGRKIYDTDVSQSALNIQATYALQPTTPSGPIRLAVFEEEALPNRTPHPTPTPRPTPTPSAAQSAFMKEEARLNEEVSQLMGTLQAEEPPSEEDSARMEARVKAINAQLKADRARLFGAPTAAPTPTPMPPRFSHLTLWDLKSGKQVWQKRLRSGSSKPLVSWSPDAKIVAVLGTPRSSRNTASRYEEQRGLDFFQGATGKSLGSGALDQVSGWLSDKDTAWLPGSWLVVKDRDEQSHPFLRLFNATNGKAVQSWNLEIVHQALGGSFDTMTTNSTGSVWAFATGPKGWRVFTQAELEAAPKPRLTPTTEAAPRQNIRF